MREALPYAGVVAFALETRSGAPPPTLSQYLYSTQLQAVAGKRLTLAAWMRADRPALRASQPLVLIDGVVLSHSLQLDTSWQRVIQTVEVPQQAQVLEVRLSGSISARDYLVRCAGPCRRVVSPSFPAQMIQTLRLRLGCSMSAHLPNLLRNAGAEGQIPPLPNTPSFLTGGLLDQRTLGKLVRPRLDIGRLSKTGAAPISGFLGTVWLGRTKRKPWLVHCLSVYWCSPACLASPGAPGAIIGRSDIRPRLCAKIWWLCLLAIALGWGAALLRVHSQPFPGTMFWSFGRYAFVAILPSLLVFSAGLGALMPMRLRAQGLAGIIGFLMIYAISALLALLHAYG